MMRAWEAKKQIIEIGRRLWLKNFVAANDGNISVRLTDNEILTTATGVSKGFLTEEMIVRVDLNGQQLERSTKYRPSSELKMHLEVYRQRADIQAVVHAHPIYATSFAVAGIPLDRCVLPEAVVLLGSVPIADFGLPSTEEVPEKIRPHIRNSDALLLANHGALTMGSDLMNAYFKMETLEHTAHIIWNAIQLGYVNVLSEETAQRLMQLRSKYGLVGRVASCKTEPLEISKPKINDLDKGNTYLNEEQIEQIKQAVLQQLKKQ